MSRVIENMTVALKNSLKRDCDEVEEFVVNALKILSIKPSNMEEITKSKEEYLKLKDKRKVMLDK